MRKAWRPTAPERQRLIVHLGNIHDAPPAVRTRQLAEKHPRFRFIGIDRSWPLTKIVRPNWEQRQTDFLSGLKGLKNESADLISSHMALGHYAKTPEVVKEVDEQELLRVHARVSQYTAECLRKAWKKLAPGGKLHLVVGGAEAKTHILEGLKAANAGRATVSVRELRGKQRPPTHHTRNHEFETTFEIRAQKPRA